MKEKIIDQLLPFCIERKYSETSCKNVLARFGTIETRPNLAIAEGTAI